jgi:hypothetical protein
MIVSCKPIKKTRGGNFAASLIDLMINLSGLILQFPLFNLRN